MRYQPRVGQYLIEDGNLRTEPFDLSAFEELVHDHLDDLVRNVEQVFQQGWPDHDNDVTRVEALKQHVVAMPEQLKDVISRLRRRLRWAMDQMNRLDEVRRQRGTLAQGDQALYNRCNNLIQRLKGTAFNRRSRSDSQDDTNTFNVLAAEGFLPGYGLETGSVNATAEIPFWSMGSAAFNLPRPPSVALREYVPGNLIYANSNRFVAHHFHRDVDENTFERPAWARTRSEPSPCVMSTWPTWHTYRTRKN